MNARTRQAEWIALIERQRHAVVGVWEYFDRRADRKLARGVIADRFAERGAAQALRRECRSRLHRSDCSRPAFVRRRRSARAELTAKWPIAQFLDPRGRNGTAIRIDRVFRET